MNFERGQIWLARTSCGMRALFFVGCSLLALGGADVAPPTHRSADANTDPADAADMMRSWRPANLDHWDARTTGAPSSGFSKKGYSGVSVDALLDQQRLEKRGNQWRWEKRARVSSGLSRHASVLVAAQKGGRAHAGEGGGGRVGGSFIEVASSRAALPATQAKSMRESIVRKLDPSRVESTASASSKMKKQSSTPALSAGSTIVAPKWEHEKARFSEVQAGAEAGAKAGANTGVGAGADPWWLNPPPWWLPPPPEWGSPPPSVYSPFYSPASIQQPFYNSPSHNSYPAYTPRPPPYRFLEINEGNRMSAYRAKRRSN